MITKTTTNMPIRISPHHLILNAAIIAKVHGEIGQLTRISTDLMAADVVLRLNHNRSMESNFSVSACLIMPDGDISESATHANLSTAISKLESRLARRLLTREAGLGKRIETAPNRDDFTSTAYFAEDLLSV